MAKYRTGKQNYDTVAELEDETLSPNDEMVFVKPTNRLYNWKAGSSTTADGVTVIDQTSETSNGRWHSTGNATQFTGTATTDAIAPGQASYVSATITGAVVGNDVSVTNPEALDTAGLVITSAYVSADDTVKVYAKNISGGDVAAQTVNLQVNG